MDDTEQKLAPQWREVALGKATEQEKIDVAVRTGELKETSFAPQLRKLLKDEESQVRYYALQALVIDLHQHDSEIEKVCWKLLEADPEDEVRSMAATCLGHIYFASGDRVVFERLVKVMKDPLQSAYVKMGAYTALFNVAGRPPKEWPGFMVPWRELHKVQIDWPKVAELEDSLDALSDST